MLVSIQSLILVPEPYFNEPGYESSIGTSKGETESKNYNSEICRHTITYAMIDMMRRPAKGFERVVQTHFALKKEEISQQVAIWVDESPKKSAMLNTEILLREAFDKLDNTV